MGAGLIGCEFANDLQPAGFSVTLIDPLKYPLGQMAPEKVGRTLQQVLQDLGVSLYFEKAVKRIDSAENGYRLTLTDESVLETDVVLSAIGLRPRTADGKDVRALFYTPERQLGGFVLMGAKVAEKMALTSI